MTTKLNIIPVAIAAAIALNLSTTDSQAQYGSCLSRQAHRIDTIAHELKSEFRLHYYHTSSYRHLTSDISEIIRRAHHIDSLSHDPYASLRHIANDLSSLDRLAHHLHDVVERAEDRWEDDGHVHGDTRHVYSLLRSLNRAIHIMQDTVEDIRRHGDDRHEDDHGHEHDDHTSVPREIIRLAIDGIRRK